MTDKEIIKALECCGNDITSSCKECIYRRTHDADCVRVLIRNALDLINRQRAEIERLNIRLRKERHQFADIGKMYSEIRAEAIKEFWSRLQGIAYQSSDWSHGEHPMVVELDDAEEIYEEMVGE